MSAPAVPVPAGAAVARRRRTRGKIAVPLDPVGTQARSAPAVLLASEGREFSAESIALAAELAGGAGGEVHVLSIARVHGVSFGLPNPGLLPSRAEWDAQHEAVARAVAKLRRRGINAGGQVLGTRKAAVRICGAAQQLGCEAIVMGADPARSRVVGDMIWSQEPQRVQRRAKIPVHLAIEDPPAAGR